jgi:hypothetical protein
MLLSLFENQHKGLEFLHVSAEANFKQGFGAMASPFLC